MPIEKLELVVDSTSILNHLYRLWDRLSRFLRELLNNQNQKRVSTDFL